jgi:cyclopropane fatty-acyl-phospholipid synthase-like methyltransferase
MMTRIWIAAAAAALLTIGGVHAQAPAEHKMEGGHRTDGAKGHQTNPEGVFRHSFEGAEKWAEVFDDPARDAWQKPDEIVAALKLPKNALVADIGAGTGYFSARLAKSVPDGEIFAADIEKDMVRYLGERAKREKLSNIVPVQSSADSANLPRPVDLILLVDTYHHIGNRQEYFAKLRGSLKPGGRLAIVDFTAESPDGPPVAHRIPLDEATAELKAAGYERVESFGFLPRQYFAVFEKAAQ